MKVKKIIIIGFISTLLLMIVLLFLFQKTNMLENKMEQLDTISLTDWKNNYDNEKEFIIVDVRTPEEFEEGHIENSININFYESNFEDQINNLDKDKKYLIYCRSGARSSKTLELMKELNFNEVYDLQGGFINWNLAGYKITYN